MRDEQVCKRCGARTKTSRAPRTTPRHAAEDTSEVVEKSSSARPAAFGRITNRANHEGLMHLGWKRACAMLWQFALVSKAQLKRHEEVARA
jgi:hypothetical protein